MASLRARRRAERALGGYPLSGVGANETTGISIYDWAKMFAPGAQLTYGGNAYQAFKTDSSGNSGSYASNPIVFAVASIRLALFSEARFQFQQMRNGKPGDLFGTQDLQILEEPWPGHTTRDLLNQAELDIMQAGNSYWVINSGSFLRLDPSKVTIVTEAAFDDQLAGWQIGDRLSYYLYKPAPNRPETWTQFLPQDVCHYMPYPDPTNRFRGQSWITPCLTDVSVDETVNAHKRSTIDNGAKLAYVVSFDPTIKKDEFDFFVDKFHRQHEGPENAGKTLFLGAGADVKTVGQNFESLQLQATQGASEVRICAAAGVPPAIVGVSEGLKGSTLNAGNYGEARRRLSDVTMRPLWGTFAGSMESLMTVPGGARLWYDDNHIAFMREDLADQAAILDNNATALQKLIQAGYKPDAAVDAVVNNDLARLSGNHTGLFSVQLVPPADGTMPNPDVAQPDTPSQPALPFPAKALPNGNGKKQPALNS